MSRPPITVATTAPVMEALELMARHRIHYLPVVDEHARLVGMVTTDDALGTGRHVPSDRDVVADVMSAPPVSIAPTAPLTDAMRLMADRSLGALPVVKHGLVVGILTQSDVVAALAHRWPA
ncbi:MAG TPA: CBS domain-containing protein [Methylomirabilota bacterium]|nr:CBS domain-containing protein [Methylomirabilota bacterium]